MTETSRMIEPDTFDPVVYLARNYRSSERRDLSAGELCLLQTTRLSSSCHDVSPTVRVKIIFLKNAEQHHHWCFPFAVDGNPEPTISWLYNGQELKKSKFTYTQFMPDSGDGSVKHGCLNLNKPTHINNGNYTLIVQNKLGREEATVFGLFMENPFGTLDPEGKILGEFLHLNIFIARKSE